jgi:hypothetical protein
MDAADEQQINAVVQEALRTGSLGTFDRLPGELRSIAKQRAAERLRERGESTASFTAANGMRVSWG